MDVSAISCEQFNAVGLSSDFRSTWRQEHETEWYAHGAGNIVGVIVLNPLSLRWSYAICTRQPGGEFSRAAAGPECRILNQARQQLLAEMVQLAQAARPA